MLSSCNGRILLTYIFSVKYVVEPYANTMGYLQGDVNLDGRTKYDGSANDRILLQNIVLTYPLNFYGSLVNNYDRLLEQLP